MIYFDINKPQSRIYNTLFNTLYGLLAFLVAFRYKTGPDTSSYMDAFDFLPNLSNLSIQTFFLVRFQPLYTLLNVICKSLYNNFVIIQILQATLFFHSLYILLKRLRLRKFYVLFLFFGYVYLAELSALRECFGLAFCFYALYFYLDRKWYIYYLLVFVGFMFHSGMIIFFIFPLFTNLKDLSYKNVFLVMSIGLLIPLVINLFQSLNINIMDNAIMRYKQDEKGYSFISVVYRIIQLLIVIYYVISRKTKCEISFIYIGGIFYVMLDLMGLIFLPQVYRFASHFSIFLYYTVFVIIKETRNNTLARLMILALFTYSPLVKFAANISEPALIYCSVFSDDKSKAKMSTITNRRALYNDYFIQ